MLLCFNVNYCLNGVGQHFCLNLLTQTSIESTNGLILAWSVSMYGSLTLTLIPVSLVWPCGWRMEEFYIVLSFRPCVESVEHSHSLRARKIWQTWEPSKAETTAQGVQMETVADVRMLAEIGKY